MKDENRKTSCNTISIYTGYLQDALFCSMVRRQDILGKKLLKTEEKYYITDHAFNHVLVDDNSKWISRILENIVYVELIRREYDVKIGKIKRKR